ncbi:MAG: hypothetical protein HEQ35_01055 [Gloeotrichia echinulata IR180]
MKLSNNVPLKAKINAINREDIIWYVLLLILLILTLITQSLAKNSVLEISNFYIPDSYTYELRILTNKDSEDFLAQTYNILNQFLYSLSSQSFFIFNASLLFISLNLCRSVFQYISPKAVNYARLAIVGNPYLLIGAVGPNKETILIFVCLIFWKFFFVLNGQIRTIVLVIIGLIPLFIRPVVSFPLYLSLVIYKLIQKKINKPRILLLLFLGSFFLFNSTPFGNSVISGLQDDDVISFSTSRIYDIALQLNSYSRDVILQYPAFLAKSAIILFAPIIRPLRILESPLPLLDIGYTIIALLLFPFNLSLVLVFLFGDKLTKRNFSSYESVIFFFTVCSILIVILNSILTFRYIFPFSPFIFSLFGVQTSQTRKYILYLTGIITLLSIWFSILYPSNDPIIDEVIPEFLEWL